MQRLHILDGGVPGVLGGGAQFIIKLSRLAGRGHRAAEVFQRHRVRAGDEVAEDVCEVAVVAGQDLLIGEAPVGRERHLAQHIVARRVDAEELHDLLGVDDVALRFRHLVLAEEHPRMPEHLMRQLDAERHQHDRPVDRVEAQDVLADEVDVRGPIMVEQLAGRAVGVVAERRDIVRQRVDPDVDDVTLVEADRDAPVKRRAGDAQVLQTRADEVVEHLVFAALGLDEVGMVEDILLERRGVFGHTEEVRLLRRALDLRAAVGAAAVLDLRLGKEALAGLAVIALVGALIDVALIVELFEDLLHGRHMLRVGRADELVVGDVHEVPDAADLAGDGVDVLLRGLAFLARLILDLLPVLVGAGQEIDVAALRAAEARDGVGQHGLVGVADVRHAGGIGDGGGYIKLLPVHVLAFPRLS